MSWKGFKKAVTRLPQQVLQKAGYADETFDEEFEALDHEFKDLEHSSKILADDSKAYVTAVTNLILAQVALGQMFQQTFHVSTEEPNSQYLEAVEAYIEASTNWLETMKPYLEQTLQSIVVDPATGFLVITKQVRAIIEKRGRKLLDYDRTRNALKKVREKADTVSTDISKVTKAEIEFQEAKRDYESLNEKLKQEIPIILRYRIDFMNPMIEALISFQIYFFEQGATILQPLNKFIDFTLPTKETYETNLKPAIELLTSLTLINPIRIDPNAAPRSALTDQPAGEKANPPPYSETSSVPAPALSSSSSSTSTHTSASTSTHTSSVPIPQPASRPAHPSDVICIAVSLFPFESETEGDLPFQADEKIQVIQKTDNPNDWWVGRIGQRQGFFPSNYVKII